MEAAAAAVLGSQGSYPLAVEHVSHFNTMQKYRCWQAGPNYPNSKCILTLRELFLKLERFGDDTFIVYETERYTFAEVLRIGGLLAHSLIESGMQLGDRVAIASRNYPEWLFAFIAVALAGGVCVPINSWWTGPELEYALVDCGAKILFADSERLQRSDFLQRIGVVAIGIRVTPSEFYRSAERVGWFSHFELVLKAAEQRFHGIPNVKISQDDDAILLYTSGTTSKPKGVLSSNRGVMSAINMLSALATINATARKFSSAGFKSRDSSNTKSKTKHKLRRQDSVLVPVPLFHATGCHAIFLASCVTGRKLVLMYKWDALRALELVQQEKCTSFTGVPTMSYEMMNHPRLTDFDTSSLRGIGGGGAPTPPKLVKQISSKFKNARPNQGYGLTETNAVGCINAGDSYIARPLSCGRPLPNVDVCIIDMQTLEKLPTDQPGELLLAGPSIMREYVNKPEKTAEAFFIDKSGKLWFRSGDIARIDSKGFVYIMDRAKDLIIRGGENISCSEVEAAVFEHPAIQEVAAFGVPHESLGEEVGVAVVCRDVAQPSLDEIRAVCKKTLASFKLPTKLFYWPESALPRGATGKIQKADIRKKILPRLSKL